MARGLKFWIKKVEGLYYPCSENKGADQLRGYREADLRRCYRICKKPVSSPCGSNIMLSSMCHNMYNASDVFRRMVLNPDFIGEYGVDRIFPFTFKTLFYRTPYSYCCCPCAYQNEYFDYLSNKEAIDQKEGRHIDEAMFEQIVQNIADSRCPHTNGVEEKYFTYSAVDTDHILAVSGSRESMKEVINWEHLYFSSIFQVHPFVNLVLKNSCQISEAIKYVRTGQFMYPIRLKDNHEIVHWKRLSVLECCARKRNSKAFQHILMTRRPHTLTCNDLACVYDLAFKYRLKELLDSLIKKGFKKFVHQESLYTKYHENKKAGEANRCGGSYCVQPPKGFG